MRRLSAGLVAVVILGAVFLSGYLLGGRRGSPAEASGAGFHILPEVQAILDERFMGEIPNAEAQERSAIRGLVSAYNDRFTVYVEPVSREMERDELRGHFGGIGAYLGRNEAGDMQVTVMRDRPAAKAGVQDGDILLAADETPITAQMTVEEVVALVRGEVGDPVTLTLRREGVAEPLKIDVVRERIETPTVEWRVLDEQAHIGYARLNLFSERTAEELRERAGRIERRRRQKAGVRSPRQWRWVAPVGR